MPKTPGEKLPLNNPVLKTIRKIIPGKKRLFTPYSPNKRLEKFRKPVEKKNSVFEKKDCKDYLKGTNRWSSLNSLPPNNNRQF